MAKRNTRRPVGQGYMPKGGVKAAQAHNEQWKQVQDEVRASVATESVQSSDLPSHREAAPGGRVSDRPGSDSTAAAFGGVVGSRLLRAAAALYVLGSGLNVAAALVWVS